MKINFLYVGALVLSISAYVFCQKTVLNQTSISEKPTASNVQARLERGKFIFQNNSVPVVKPSDFIEVIRKKKTENPNLTTRELAAFGNDFIAKNGFDYTFDWTPKGKENEANLSKIGEGFHPFFYQFTDFSGKSRKFELMNDGFEHPCYSVIDIPVTKVNERTMTVISDGNPFELKRPKDFSMEEVVLMDASLKKEIRKWNTPIDAMPLGISADGKKIYFNSWEFIQDENDGYKESEIGLAIEISENGTLKLVDLKSIESGKGVTIKYDEKYPEISYTRYKVGKNVYVIKHSAPCT